MNQLMRNKRAALDAVGACTRHFKVNLHGHSVIFSFQDEDLNKILLFLFGSQAEITQVPTLQLDSDQTMWRIAILASDAIFEGWKNVGEVVPQAAFSQLKSYWRPDFAAAFLALTPDLTVVRHKEPFAGLTMLVPDERLIIYVRPRSEPIFVPHVDTLAGYIWRCAMWRDGSVDLHSATVSHLGCGIVIIGPKMAGKTSLAMHFLAHGAQLLGSDFCEIAVAHDGRLRAKAIPQICRITPETVSDNAVLSGAIDVKCRFGTSYREGVVFSHGKFEFFAPGVDVIFERPVNIVSMSVDLIIFPKFSRELERQRITSLNGQIACEKLATAILHDRPLADWLPLPEVASRASLEAPTLSRLADIPVKAFQMEFGQEPSLDWAELDGLIKANQTQQS
ncbi:MULTISPECIES: phosphoenolpyruvate carboxykinase (ATP) [Rhizobium]|uniref:hypothetical protein n=1 Tax=Rhizobium TaxID=379 RepID=UPI000F77D4D4|nr:MULTISPECIES: hypothetical protein [Rhizobium]MBA9036823.1 hypothetical protein [Rhizobium leguminosarum]TBB57974.1 hypothetical protein ELH43_40315 [Rhizobium ruizarguesonis]TBF43777.1 hypothetical protein ELG90_36350 [Rhizobium leguminosarum]TBF85876.1 hypothetical protein ELG85_36780 [Rhizobium leguminosarum]TBG09959.1 hypothetical protein ELG79_34675 [Rhizobium leguminosarum]